MPGKLPPPPPLSKKAFEDRIKSFKAKNGREPSSMAELDPEFSSWCIRRSNIFNFRKIRNKVFQLVK